MGLLGHKERHYGHIRGGSRGTTRFAKNDTTFASS